MAQRLTGLPVSWQGEINGGGKVILHLSWPDTALSPNARVHWAAKAKAAKNARAEGYYAAISHPDRKIFQNFAGKLQITARFYSKTRNYPDADNCLASIKAHLDGIAEALDVNDRQFVHHAIVEEETGGRVVVEVVSL